MVVLGVGGMVVDRNYGEQGVYDITHGWVSIYGTFIIEVAGPIAANHEHEHN